MTRLSDAISFAAQCHDGMLRKGTNLPYIVHPAEVTAIVAAMTDEEDVLCAAALHDVMEDCGVTFEMLKQRFGTRVAQLVESETQPHSGDPCATWDARKAAAVKRLAAGSRDTKIIALADKLSNMRAIRRDYDRFGQDLFIRFHQHKKSRHAWYYRSILFSLKEEFDRTDAWRELYAHVEYVFGAAMEEEGQEEYAV